MTKRSETSTPALDPERYLKLRGGKWSYRRRVPEQCAHLDKRGEIVTTLRTSSLDVAKLRRDAMERADDLYWQSLLLDGSTDQGSAAYASARSRAAALGFEYKAAADIAATSTIEEMIRRAGIAHASPIRDEAAVLGAIDPPGVTVKDAMREYVEEIGIGQLKGKSPTQKRKWREQRYATADNFAEIVGDKQLLAVTRADAVKYETHWKVRVFGNDRDGIKPTHSANTANRQLGNMRKLFREYARHHQLDIRNPFDQMTFADSKRSKLKILPFKVEFITKHFLTGTPFLKLNEEARLIFLALIETGCRPSEICNLAPERIFLNAPVPYILVEFEEDRELKTETSIRSVPLLGVSLEAMRRAPRGFPAYRDKEGSFSGTMMKHLRKNKWLPSNQYRVYSLRHAMEDRMKAAGFEDDFRRMILGHSIDRPEYGEGWTLDYKAEQLGKITLPFEPSALEGILGPALRLGGRPARKPAAAPRPIDRR